MNTPGSLPLYIFALTSHSNTLAIVQSFQLSSSRSYSRVDLRKFPKIRVVKLMDVEEDVALDV
jgi:hypothetical protein